MAFVALSTLWVVVVSIAEAPQLSQANAPHTGDVVKISPLSDPYYVANWVGARRVL
jgi:hypothetical protein